MLSENDKQSIRQLVKEEFVKSNTPLLKQSDFLPRLIKPRHNETVFANMYAYQAAVVVTVAAADTWYEVTSGLTEGLSDGVDIQNGYQHKLRYGGKYLVIWSLSMSTGTANDELMGAVGINGTVETSSAGQTTVANANAKGGANGSAILDLSAGDLISLFVHNETFARDVTIEHASCNVLRIG